MPSDWVLRKRPSRTPVHAAAYNDHCESLQMLLSNGGDVNRLDNSGKTPLMYAAMNGQTGTLGQEEQPLSGPGWI